MNNAKTTLRGLCSWCFRDFAATSGNITQRHGWQESGGTRRAGEYGNVYHSGNCGGMHYAPYELSCEGTKVLLGHEVQTLAAINKTLAELAARPMLTITASVSVGYVNYQAITAAFQLRLVDGEERVAVQTTEKPWDLQRFSYNRALARRVQAAEQAKTETENAISFLEEMIAAWKLAPLRATKTRKATVHHKNDGAKFTACGSKSHTVETTTDVAKVTCGRCAKYLAGEAKTKASADEVQVVADAIKAHLVTNGGHLSAKAIKKALPELDKKLVTKALNKLTDRLEHKPGTVGKTWHTPATYWVIRMDWRTEFRAYNPS